MNIKQIFTFAIIAMFLLVPFASAKQEVADSVKQNKKIDEKVTDKTKESAKEISNKNKDIKGKVTVTDSYSSKYTVEKKSKTEIRIAKDEVKGEHTKSKVAFAKEDLQKIDVDRDKLYGVLHIADDGSTTHDVVTESQLTSGTEMIFSENIVNGYSGYYEKTQTGVTSGTTIDIPDVSGSDYYITMSVTGSIPAYQEIQENNISAYPGTIRLLMPMNNATNLVLGNVFSNKNVTFANGKSSYNGMAYLTSNMNASSIKHIGMIIKPTTRKNEDLVSRWGPPGSRGYTLTMRSSGSFGIQLTPNGTGYTNYASTGTITPGIYSRIDIDLNATHLRMYINGRLDREVATNTTVYASPSNISIGKTAIYTAFTGSIDQIDMYTTSLTSSQTASLYAHANGISARPLPSQNFTGYNVASGVEKIIDTDATCTGLEYIDTTGGTHTVTVRIYSTEDITKTTETKGAVYQKVSIIHTKQNATASVGTIVYELDPLYSGTPVLTSNNTNATVSRNDTHVLISTGLVKQGQSFSYAVSVADDHNHGFHIGDLMKWVGTGWDFVSTAPEDWSNYIGDEIEVTVS